MLTEAHMTTKTLVYWPFSRTTWVSWYQNVSPFSILFELRMMEMVVTTGAIRRAKFQSNYHLKHTNFQLLTG